MTRDEGTVEYVWFGGGCAGPKIFPWCQAVSCYLSHIHLQQTQAHWDILSPHHLQGDKLTNQTNAVPSKHQHLKS